MNVSDHRVEGFTGNGVVFAGSQLGSQTLVQNGLSGNLGKYGDAQSHPCQLEAVSQKIEVSSHEDDSDDTSVGDSRGAYQQNMGRLATSTDTTTIANAGVVMTYEGCSTTEARRRRSGSASRAGR